MWRHRADLAVVDSDDRVVVLDLHQLAVPPRILEGSAAEIWRTLDGVRPTSTVVTEVGRSFGVEPSDVEADVVAFLGSLASAGLIEPS